MLPTQLDLIPSESQDFGIEIDFIPNSTDPSRVFRAMTQLIEASEIIDERLAEAFSITAKPILLLQGIEASSLLARLRSAVQSVDDDALKSGDWKKVVGTYLVNGKRELVKFMEKRETISSAEEIYDLQRVIHEAARQTGLPLETDPAVPAVEVAESVSALAQACSSLTVGDSAKYLTTGRADIINGNFRVTTQQIEGLLTYHTLVNTETMILKVKKPDFLGESIWEFRYEGKRTPVKVADEGWLKDFHDGKIELRPGYAIQGSVEVETKYGQDNEVIAIHRRIMKVENVIPKERLV